MKSILTLLTTLLTFSVYAQSPSTPELHELEQPLFKNCENARGGYEFTFCLEQEVKKLQKSIQSQLEDDCRWNIWVKEAKDLCYAKAEYEGQGAFLDRRVAYCLITQNLMLYGEFLDRKFGGRRHVHEDLLIDLMIDPDSPQILPLQNLRQKILDKDSKEIKCVQRPMV